MDESDSGSVDRRGFIKGAAAGALAAGSPGVLHAQDHQELPSDPALRVKALETIGDRVRGRNINPAGHTRMPRYTRLRTGTVERDRGVFALPDSEGTEPRLQHVYLIRFAARELWGETAHARDSVRIDMWEDYLEPA